VGFLSDSDLEYPVLGRVDQIDEIIRKNHVDMVVFNLPAEKRDLVASIVISSENLNVEYMITPDIQAR